MLGDTEMSAWLTGYLALWHPALIEGAEGPPRIDSQYDHEQPKPAHIYARPEQPELYLPEDWDQRLSQAGAVAFTSHGDWPTTLASLHQAFPDLPPVSDDVGLAFRGVGLGYRAVESLFDAMHHEHQLSADAFWTDVQSAIAAWRAHDVGAVKAHLKSAAEKLLAAREILYPTTIHLIDLIVPDPRRLSDTVPSFAGDHPVSLIASGQLLERLRDELPDRFAELKHRAGGDTLEIVAGAYREREDTLLPVESQLWNLRRASSSVKELLGAEVRIFGRRRTAFGPQTPQFLHATEFDKAVFLAFDGAVVPSHRSTVINWSGPDGRTLDAFARSPQLAHQPQTFFNLVHSLHETIMQDSAATLGLLHSEGPAAVGYAEWVALSQFAPVLGQWTTLGRYFAEAMAGEYAPTSTIDEFFTDYLDERSGQRLPDTVSGFAGFVRRRRRVDAAMSLAAIRAALGGDPATVDALTRQVLATENRFEAGDGSVDPESDETQAAELLSQRLLARATGASPGYMVLNPCSFIRRVAVELPGEAGPIPVGGPVKASQFDGDTARVVVEVPQLGFAWFPRGEAGAKPPAARMRLADGTIVRNEFFEAEVDPATGGLRGLRDPRTRINRIGQQLVFNPGSVMKAKEVRVTCVGPAMGEVTSEGAICDDTGATLATFRQRFRAWLGRPLLEMRIELFPQKRPEGYPWHAYYGARFAWRDERSMLLRGINGSSHISNHNRPVTPDFIELRSGGQNVVLFPGGLPFHQRHGGRMFDVILVPEGEAATCFDLALGLDREYPVPTAFGLTTPVTCVPTAKGPPHIGPSGWLFHVDATNLLLTSLRPAPVGEEGGSAIVAQFLESSGFGGACELRCVRNPRRAYVIGPGGSVGTELTVSGDTVHLDATAHDIFRVRIEFA
jgi:hypothetical protein